MSVWVARILAVVLLLFGWALLAYATRASLWSSVAAAAVAAVAAARSDSTPARALWFNVAAVVVLVTTVLTVYTRVTDPGRREAQTVGDFVHDDRTYDADGRELPRDESVPSQQGQTWRGVLHRNGELVYDVSYHTDFDGLRTTGDPNFSPDSPCILFFGCSFMFGEGVDDRDTLPYRVRELAGHGYVTRNFGGNGFGAHHMLERLLAADFQTKARCRATHAVYESIHDHIGRTTGSPRADGDPAGPRFVVGSDATLRRDGNFRDGLFSFAAILQAMPDNQLIQRLRVKLYDEPDERDWKHYARVVAASARRADELYPGIEFDVLHWDRSGGHELAATLEAEGLDVHLVHDVLPPVDDWEGQYALRYDRHPTAAANELLARYVVSDIAGLNTSPAHRRASTQP